MKVLFLDIDGVLNSLEWAKVNGFGCPPGKAKRCSKDRLKWDPSAVKRLRRVIETTGASIVISSAWRGYGASAVRKWRAMFAVYGWRRAPVIGETPDLAMCHPSGIYAAVKRGEEVDAWIKSHPHVIDKFVCVDDGNDWLPHQPVVITSMEFGLTETDVQECIRLLNG